MKTIKSDWMELQVGDGSKMSAFAAFPENSQNVPGIIVLQEAYGVNSHIRDVTQRFAREGYVAIAPELFHRTAPARFEGNYGDFAGVMEHYQAVNQQTLEADLKAAHSWLQSRAEVEKNLIASIGFCMGGKASFIANAALPLKAAISFYGGGIATDHLGLAEKQHAPILMIWGGKDNHIPAEQRRAVADALTQAGKPFVNTEFSEADHGFFCDQRSQYHPQSATEAWALSMQFLKNQLQIR